MSSFTGPAFAEDDVAIIPQLISTTVIPRPIASAEASLLVKERRPSTLQTRGSFNLDWTIPKRNWTAEPTQIST